LPEITVVVPTRDRPDALHRCLAALDAQTAADRLEVIVVDDGSTDSDAVGGVVGRHPAARSIRHESRAGPAAARNTGARFASGTILCFTDDDCVPEPQWVERLATAIADGADAVAGTTLPAGGALAVASELIARAPAALEPFAPSNNVACTKALIELVPFDETYPSAAGEDREWCAQIAVAGYTLRAADAARLTHRQNLTLRSFLARQLAYGAAAYRFRRGRPAPPAFYVSLLSRAFAQGASIGTLVAIAQVVTALGFIRARLTDRGDARRARPARRRPP
jgi:glycosyltransferase involved in cell wall biosynthesis